MYFRKPGDFASTSSDLKDYGQSALDSIAAIANPYISQSIEYQRQRLPIYQTLILVGETGSGKSTQVPQYLLECGYLLTGKAVAVTQPRRVAAVTLANRVAEERQSALGHEVGYCVRFDCCLTPGLTKIKFMTDGILLREILIDPLLKDYSVVMIDEAHERTINTDIILGLLRKILKKRKDLKVIVSSATIDAEKFRDFFNFKVSKSDVHDTATIMSVEGRTYPVEVVFSKNPVPDYLKASISTAFMIHESQGPGDILIFLTGQDEVEAAVKMLHEGVSTVSSRKRADRLWIVPLYGGLPAREQLKAFDSTPAGSRKVVVATNVAETSVTIPGIVYVIDCGFVKLRALHQRTLIESLVTVPISQASAEQRSGRAGRVKPGKAFRLYPESEYEKMLPDTIPEIQRTDLAPVILQLNAMGIHNILGFHLPQKPPRDSLISGYDLLYAVKAIDSEGVLTNPLGLQMAELPLPPMHAKALLISGEYGCSEEMLTIISMMQIQDVFISPQGEKQKAERARFSFAVEEGDHLTLFNIFKAFQKENRSSKFCEHNYLNYRGLLRAEDIRAQLTRLLERFKIPVVSCKGDTDKVRKCLVLGFFSNAAKVHYSGKYITVRGDLWLKVHQSSIICYLESRPEWIIFTEIMQDSLKEVTVIEPQWLSELVPEYFECGTERELTEKHLVESSAHIVKKQRT